MNAIKNNSGQRLLAGVMTLLLLWSALAALFPARILAASEEEPALASLSISSGSLSPAFQSTHTSYAANVADSVNALSLTPTASDSEASISVSINGDADIPVASGAASPSLPLEIGRNVIAVRVESADGQSRTDYSIALTKTAIVLQQGAGYAGQKDAHVSEGKHGSKNTGANEAIEVGYFDPLKTDRKWGLFQFDVSSIPQGALVKDARLELNLIDMRVRSGAKYDKTLNLYKITSAWEEGTGAGYDGTAGAPGVVWGTKPGFDETAALDSKVVGTTLGTWYDWGLTELAQKWIDGSEANNGVILKEIDSASDGETTPSTKDFASAQQSNASIRPKLALNYEMPLTGIRMASEPVELVAGQAPVELADYAFPRPLNAHLDEALAWSSSDAAVATVDAAGTVTPVGPGTAEIQVTATGNGTSYSDTVQVTVTELNVQGVLSGLEVKGAAIVPGFKSEVHEYTLEVPLNAKEVYLTPTAFEQDAVITVTADGAEPQTVASGSLSQAVPLQQDATRVDVKVESQHADEPGKTGVYTVLIKHRETGGTGDQIIRDFLDPNGRVLVVAHRGNWLNGMPENGLNSIRASIEEGVDMVELDIRTTSDGVPVLMHDDSVNRTTNGSGNVGSLTLAQIKQLCLRNSNGTISNPCETIPTLEEAMTVARGHIMVNLDIKNANWDTMWDILVRTDTTDHALYKTGSDKSSTAAWMAKFHQSAVQPLFMQLTSDPGTARDFMNPATTPFTVNAFEISFNDDNAPIVDPALISELRAAGARIWVNTIFSVPGLVGRHGDYAFLSDPNAGYPWLLNRGVNMIQTDTTALLLHYLEAREGNPQTGVTQTTVLQNGAGGYAGTSDTQIVELPANDANSHNFGHYMQLKVGPQQPVLPMMNGNVSGKVATVSATGTSPDKEGKDNLIDYGLGAKWLAFQNQAVVTFAMKAPVAVNGYALSSANDTPARDPKDWTFEGSNDGQHWDVLDTRTEQSFADRFTTNSYRNIGNQTAYAMYRFNFTANHGDGYLQIAEIQLSDGSAVKPDMPATQDHRNGLMRFDLSSIPKGAKIVSAKLGLYMLEAGIADETLVQGISVHRVTESWNEGEGTGDNGSAVPSGKNWTTWETRPTYDTVPSVTASIDKQAYRWNEIDMTGLAKGWMEQPASNFGFLLEGKDKAYAFASSDNVLEWRPKLELTYTIPATGVTITPSELTLEAGEQSKLSASVLPDYALNRDVTWSSNNEAVATIDSTGTVHAISKGSAVMTATTVDGGHTASMTVTVTRPQATGSLQELRLSAGEFTTPFQPETTTYAAAVPETYNHLAITPIAEDEDAVIALSVNGETPTQIASGQQSSSFPLEIGDNRIIVTVSIGGTIMKTYDVTVPKAAVALQQGVDGYAGTADTQLSQGTGSTGNKYYQYNLGGQHGIEVGYYNQSASDQKYGLIRFDNLPIPEGAIVSEATLNLYHYAQRSTNRPFDIFAHRANAPWTEGSGGSGDSNDGSPGQAGEVTWENYITNGTDPFASAPSATVNVNDDPAWYAFNLSGDVQQWIDTPANNYGVVLKTTTYQDASNPEMTGTKRFRTKDYTDVSQRPYLRIVYTMPIQAITLDRSELDLLLGGSGSKLVATIKPLNVADRSVRWTSSDENVAAVDADGNVTAVGEGTATITAANAVGGEAHASVRVRKSGVSADLNGLQLTAGQLSPAFAKDLYEYKVLVPAGSDAIQVTPDAVDERASITVRTGDGEPVEVKSGTASMPIAAVDGTTIVVAVTSEDGQAKREYRIVVERSAALTDIGLSAGSLSPAFAPDRLQYTVEVPNSVTELKLRPAARDASLSIVIGLPDGVERTVASGEESEAIALQTGVNLVTLEARAAGVADRTIYTIAVHRQAPADSGHTVVVQQPAAPAGETKKLGDELTVDIPQENQGLGLKLRKLEAGTDTAPYKLISPVYAIETDSGRKLSKAITLSIQFDASSLGGGRASVFRLDETGHQWIELGGYVKDGTITVATLEIGKFAVYSVDGEQKPELPNPTWSDVNGHWAAAEITEAVKLGILTGYPDGSMKPDAQLTRAQFSAMLVRALGLSEAHDLSGFADRKDIPAWAEESLGAAVAAGIVTGYEDGTLLPNKSIDRAEMITMLVRAFQLGKNEQSPIVFKDEDKLPDWSKASIHSAAGLGIIEGYQGEFRPANGATRAEAVTVILRTLSIAK
ncbi:DNRLRE domain-containing protein [Paenibacillus glycinis]|uniref:DNRLRE domain-containing protein n=1 Tax=Paenibacillus glycinis TaxID=2697035 RepID=A0ABW9XI21_9BACL|nr:DNRLRE domain-containing protein [Paenibacillus glycinis]NBD22250.1 DNRLRE domain-containing protein [Paenibacillus glycinis]